MIWVSGGTNDSSFERLSDHVKSKLQFVENPKTLWNLDGGIEKGFSPNHINTMLNEGLSRSNADFVFCILSDYILESGINRLSVERSLEKTNGNSYWYKFKRRKLVGVSEMSTREIFDTRQTICINVNKTKHLFHYPNIFGISKKTNIILDSPIIYPTELRDYTVNNLVVTVPLGYPNDLTVASLEEMQVYVPDHFFYSYELLLKQRILFYKYFNALPNGRKFIPYVNLFNKCGLIKGRVSLDHIRQLDIPNEFLLCINEYYKKYMLGLPLTIKPVPGIILKFEKVIEYLFPIFWKAESPYKFTLKK